MFFSKMTQQQKGSLSFLYIFEKNGSVRDREESEPSVKWWIRPFMQQNDKI